MIRTAKPAQSSAICSLLPSAGGTVEISFQWSPSFTSQYNVERYHVSVNPDPSSCSSDQVSPSVDYSCSGLVLGTRYTFRISAINCGDQEGEETVMNYDGKCDIKLAEICEEKMLFSPLALMACSATNTSTFATW